MVPQVLLPDVVLVQVELVLVFVVFRGGRNVPLLGVAAVLGADGARGRFVLELGVALGLLLTLGVRDQLVGEEVISCFRRAQLPLVNRNGRRWGDLCQQATTTTAVVPRSVRRRVRLWVIWKETTEERVLKLARMIFFVLFCVQGELG